MSVILLSLFSLNCLNLKYEDFSLFNLKINNACTEKVMVIKQVGCNTYRYSYFETFSVTLRACILQGGSFVYILYYMYMPFLCVLSYYVSLRSEFLVVMSITISA
jgi:hypothetical protein